jgi:hypothetical protein
MKELMFLRLMRGVSLGARSAHFADGCGGTKGFASGFSEGVEMLLRGGDPAEADSAVVDAVEAATGTLGPWPAAGTEPCM